MCTHVFVSQWIHQGGTLLFTTQGAEEEVMTSSHVNKINKHKPMWSVK